MRQPHRAAPIGCRTMAEAVGFEPRVPSRTNRISYAWAFGVEDTVRTYTEVIPHEYCMCHGRLPISLTISRSSAGHNARVCSYILCQLSLGASAYARLINSYPQMLSGAMMTDTGIP